MSELNLRIGDCVHYGAHGVCKVYGRETKKLGRDSRDYFLLRPLSDEKITLYLPVDAEPGKVHMRQVMSAGEIYQLVEREREYPVTWISDSKLRREVCGKTLRSGDIEALMRMVKDLHAREETLPTGKVLPMSDLELLQSAEKQLYNEFQFVLEIDKEQVLPFILGKCKVPAKNKTVS